MGLKVRSDRSYFCKLALICALVAVTALAAPMIATAQITPPPRHDTKTPTGVSFRSGAFSFEEEDLAIGGDTPSGLRLVRSYNSASDGVSDPFLAAVGWSHSFNIYIASQPLPQNPDDMLPPGYRGRCVYNVVGGSGSVGFINYAPVTRGQTACGGARTGPYVPITPAGGSLTYVTTTTPNYYRYVGPDGSVINFSAGANGRASNWTMPDGTRLDFTYVSGQIKSVFSNRGWAMLFESQFKACAVNLAQTYVTATSACPSGVQTVTYTYSPGTYVTSWNLMTSVTRGGSTRYYQYASNDHVDCIKDPGQTTCRIQNVYSHCPEDPSLPNPQPAIRLHDQVLNQTDGTGRVYTYTYSQDNCPQWPSNTDPDYRPFQNVTTNVTQTGVSGATVGGTDTAAQLISLTAPLGATTQFGYDGSTDYFYETGEPNGSVQPEGNQEQYTRNSRGNITTRTVMAKPGSGLANQVTAAVYPATCSNVVTCNKATSVTNPRGGVTDFTYDATHGGVLTETAPADVNGIRPVKRYSYVQRTAWVKTNTGGYVASTYPVWVQSEIRTCRTSATVGNTCAAGAMDEVVTTYDYGPNSGPNNLLLRGMVVTSGGVSLRTCYGYDQNGRRISETQPNANLTSCL